MKVRALAPVALTASTLAVALTACGGSSSSGTTAATTTAAAAPSVSTVATPSPAAGALDGKTPAQILAATNKAIDAATSVHVSGDMVDGKDKISLDLSVSRSKGGQATGTLTVGGDKMSIRRLGSTLYFRTGKNFWIDQGGADSATASLLADRWIKATKSQKDFADFFDITSVKGLTTEGIEITKAEIATLKTVTGKTVNGTPSVGLFEPKSAVNDEAGTLYIAATGDPLPVEITSGKTKVDYTDWNQPLKVTTPSNALDLAKLGG